MDLEHRTSPPAGLPARIRRRLAQDEGVSLVELLVAFTVLALVMTGVASTVTQSLRVTGDNRARIVATNVMTEELENLRLGRFEDLPLGLTTHTVSRGQAYTVRRQLQWVPVSATTSACMAPTTGAAAAPAYVRADVAVTWAGSLGQRPVSTQTILTPPVAGQDPYRGNVSVVVRDRDGRPGTNQTVRVTGPGVSQTRTTDAEGCAFLVGLPAANYTVRLSSSLPGPWIDRTTLLAEPTQVATVTAATTSRVEFEYDRASGASVTVSGRFGGTIPASIGIVLRNTAVSTDQIKFYAAATQPVVFSPLFPYPAGYEVWAGRCTDANPSLVGGAPTTIGATPGSMDTVALEIATVNLQVTRTGGALSGTTVTQRPNQTLHGRQTTAGGACDPTPSTSNNGTRDQRVLGTTNATGALSVAVPYGTWQISTTSSFPNDARTRTVQLRADDPAATAFFIQSAERL